MGHGRGALVFRYGLLVGADLIGRAMNFAVMMMVVRRFGPAVFGEVGLAASIVSYGLVAGTCGLDVFAVRSVARDATGLPSLAGTIVALRLCLGLGAYLALLALAFTLPSLRGLAGLIALAGLSLFTGALSLSWIPEGLQKAHILALAYLGVQSINLVLLLAALRMEPSISAIPIAQVVAEGLVALGLFAWVRRCVGRLDRPTPGRVWPEILRRSAPIGGARVLRSVSMGSDLVLLSLFVPLKSVGWYTGAYRLYLMGVALAAQYFVVLFPRLARAALGRGDEIHREIRASSALGLAVAVPVAVLAIPFAGNLLEALFDPSFAAASASLRLLIVTLLVYFVGSHYRSALNALGRQKTDLMIVGGASAAHVAAKLILIPIAGISGAAMGTLTGEVVLAALGWWAMRQEHPAGIPSRFARERSPQQSLAISRPS